MAWLCAEMDDQDKSLVSVIWCIVCQQYKIQICRLKNFFVHCISMKCVRSTFSGGRSSYTVVWQSSGCYEIAIIIPAWVLNARTQRVSTPLCMYDALPCIGNLLQHYGMYRVSMLQLSISLSKSFKALGGGWAESGNDWILYTKDVFELTLASEELGSLSELQPTDRLPNLRCCCDWGCSMLKRCKMT